ncbi:MAG: hypothetical protein WBC82_01100 [Dehalococcoidia bacterium]
MIGVVAIVIAALSAHFSWQANQVSEQANQVSEQANQLAEQANRILKEANLPIVTAVIASHYDESQGTCETIAFSNGGGPLHEFRSYLREILVIDSNDNQMYVMVNGYFDCETPTGKSQGMLLEATHEGNWSKLQEFEWEVRNAAHDDGHEVSLWNHTLAKVLYRDYTGVFWSKYLGFSNNVSYEIDNWQEYHEARWNAAFDNWLLASNQGVSLNIDHFDGVEVWEWYRDTFLY